MNVHGFEVHNIDGNPVSLRDYAGKTLLIVNVASQCGLTPQYEGLETLYRKYGEQGFAVLGFPCNQFGSQEPGTESEIKTFCSTSYGVTFPLFSKVDVNGAGAHPLFRHLRKEALNDEPVKWNFTKFLIDRDGKVVRAFEPTTTPDAIDEHVNALLHA